MFCFFRELWKAGGLPPWEQALDAQYQPLREELRMAGLSEKKLRRMTPDDRVKVLEQAKLDPYDYIYLAC